MQSSQNHIINKVILEVNTPNEETAYKIKDKISSFLNSEVFPKMEKLMDKYGFDDQVFRFDSLYVDCDVQDWDRPEEIKFELLKNIELKINDNLPELNTAISSKNISVKENSKEPGKDLNQIIDKQNNYRNTNLFFLEKGFLPWYGKQEYVTEILSPKEWTNSVEYKKYLSELAELFIRNDSAIQRFILQFSNDQILDFIESTRIIEIKNKSELLNFIQASAPQMRHLFLDLLLKISLNAVEHKTLFVEFAQQQLLQKDYKKITKQMVVDWNLDFLSGIQSCFSDKDKLNYFKLTPEEIQYILKEINFADTQVGLESEESAKANLENKPTIFLQEFVNSEKEKEKEPAFFENYRSEILVRNAGMVLFHPFLNAYFSQFGWVNPKGEIKVEHRWEAVQALHYCATQSESFFEGNLILEKFLCGVPLTVPIPVKSLLNKQMKLEAEAMLEQIIDYWAALKNTSPSGLREMFINRNGKLVQKDNGFKLIVERKVQDILLDKLQWNISIVKLPWRKDLLFVEW